ncbi:MAG: 7TM diverse intracellular signaling domain-containing protein, partial [Dokdonella sp.]
MLARLALFALLFVTAFDAVALSAAVPIHAAWMPATAQTSANALPERSDPAWRAFDHESIGGIARGSHGAWVRLDVIDRWPANELVLSILTPPYDKFTVFDSNGAAVRTTSLMDLESQQWHGHGRVAIALDDEILARPFVLLRLEPDQRVSSGLTFRIDPIAEFLRADANWLAFASACLAVMFSMSMMAICFGILLRDRTFFFYAAYVLSYAVIQGVQSGYAAHPLGIEFVAGNPRLVGISALLVSVVAATLFTERFVDLRRHAPGLRVIVLALAAAVVVNGALGLLPIDVVRQL